MTFQRNINVLTRILYIGVGAGLVIFSIFGFGPESQTTRIVLGLAGAVIAVSGAVGF